MKTPDFCMLFSVAIALLSIWTFPNQSTDVEKNLQWSILVTFGIALTAAGYFVSRFAVWAILKSGVLKDGGGANENT